MANHLTEVQITGYRTRTLVTEELLRVSDHIVSCQACRDRLLDQSEALAIAMARAQFAKGTAHLTYDELETYVDRRLDPEERGRIERHVGECAGCAVDLREMEELAHPAPAAAGAVRSFWTQIWRWQTAVAFTAACVLGLVVFLWPHNRQSEPIPPTIARHAPENADRSVLHDAQLAIRITGNAVSGLDAVPQPFRGNVEQALLAGRINPPPTTNDILGRQGTLMGRSTEKATTTLLSPVSTVVEDTQPVFHWTATPDAEYRVTVGNRSLDEVASSAWTRDTSWRIPVRLVSNERYSWQLVVRAHGRETTVPVPPMPDARFRILSSKDKEELEHLRITFANSHLLMGIVSAQYGLLDAAEQELDAAYRQHPDSREVAGILQSIRKLRGNPSPPAIP